MNAFRQLSILDFISGLEDIVEYDTRLLQSLCDALQDRVSKLQHRDGEELYKGLRALVKYSKRATVVATMRSKVKMLAALHDVLHLASLLSSAEDRLSVVNASDPRRFCHAEQFHCDQLLRSYTDVDLNSTLRCYKTPRKV